MKKIVKKYPLLGSSENPENLSLTVKSVGVWLIPLVITVAQLYKIEISQSDLTIFVEVLSTTVAGCMTVYGLIRKFYNSIKK